MNNREQEEIYERIRDCSQRLKLIADNTWDGNISANDANDLYFIVGELRNIARELKHGPQ